MKNIKASPLKLNSGSRYTTYQLYGEMNNKNTKLSDGLKIAALSCFYWLRERLGNKDIPKELKTLDPSEYKKAKDSDFHSFTLNQYYVLNVVTSIEDGIFALKLIENDSGALNNEEIVIGRSIQSDIAFRIVEDKLECAFKTSVYDLNNVPKAKCIRFSLIKLLVNNPNFELKQIVNIYNPGNMDIKNETALEEIKDIYDSQSNELPFIIYAYDDLSDISLDDFDTLPYSKASVIPRENLKIKEINKITDRSIAYSYKYLGYARPYFLPKIMFKDFKELFKTKAIKNNNVIIIEPKKGSLVSNINIYDYQDKETYQSIIFNYNREKHINFHDALFYEEANSLINNLNDEQIDRNKKQLQEVEEKLLNLQNKYDRENRKNNHVTIDNNTQELEETLNKLRQATNDNDVLKKEITRLNNELIKKNEYINFIKRKEKMPKAYKDIASWAKDFKYVELHDKAIDCLNDRSAENVDVEVICEAIDYLENAYAQYLFNNLSKEELNDISSNIYNRPYDVTPSGITKEARGNCKIKYKYSKDTKRKEYPLDQHLRIGKHGELLRIYFIVDKDNKKIIIGSLPNHLEY